MIGEHSKDWQPSADRARRVEELMLQPEQFALISGANTGFNPRHPEPWMIFWKEDICEKDQCHTQFPALSLLEARRVWMAMEEHFFSRYDCFLRVWPEWYSTGIWATPYPGSRRAGRMMSYQDLPLPGELIERFTAWQEEFDEGHPCEPLVDSEGFTKRAEALARDLKRCVGPRVYVELYELAEVLMDGTTRSCRPLLGLPDPE